MSKTVFDEIINLLNFYRREGVFFNKTNDAIQIVFTLEVIYTYFGSMKLCIAEYISC
jgi:hypothetical protein